MFRFNTLPLVLMLTALLSLASCADEKAPSRTVAAVDEQLGAFAESSCKYQFNEGPSAVPESQSDIRKVQFGKKLDFHLLTPVFTSSASELVRFAETLGVQYFKTAPFQQDGCNFAAILPAAPADVEAIFAKQRADVLGQYYMKGMDDFKTTRDNAAIVVTSDTNKWILIHEFMHHLFRLGEAGEVNALTVERDANESMRAYNDALDAVDESTGPEQRANMLKALSLLRTHNRHMMNFIKTFPLEEMTIETQLADFSELGALKFVPEKQRVNGAGYILMANSVAQNYIKKLLSANSYALYEFDSVVSSLERKNFDAFNAKLKEMSAQANEMTAAAHDFLKSQNINVDSSVKNGILSNASKFPVASCSQERAGEKLLPAYAKLHKKLQLRAQRNQKRF